jgi:multisubunit Na+/H+ antiporter MnhB subunit
MGMSFFLDYEPIIGIGWSGGSVTVVSFVILGLLYAKSKNKGEVFDERFRTRYYSILGLGYGITNIGIALVISSVFYNVGEVMGIDVLIYDIVGFLFVGWGIPLILFTLGEFGEGRKA